MYDIKGDSLGEIVENNKKKRELQEYLKANGLPNINTKIEEEDGMESISDMLKEIQLQKKVGEYMKEKKQRENLKAPFNSKCNNNDDKIIADNFDECAYKAMNLVPSDSNFSQFYDLMKKYIKLSNNQKRFVKTDMNLIISKTDDSLKIIEKMDKDKKCTLSD